MLSDISRNFKFLDVLLSKEKRYYKNIILNLLKLDIIYANNIFDASLS